MRKLALGLMTAFMLLTIIPTQSKAATKENSSSVTATKTTGTVSEEDMAIMARMKEIKAMDMSKLSPQERRHYRNEYRSDRSHMRSHSTVYFAGGGGLLLVVVLIIILI